MLCVEQGTTPVHARTIFRALYKRGELEPWQDATMPKSFRHYCAMNLTATLPGIDRAELSRYDGSVKFLVRLADDALVEMVLMPEKKRITLCLSTQVGCAQACVFCHTGRMGLKRQLSGSEIVGQVVLAGRWIKANTAWLSDVRLPVDASVTNLVFMGMGEPLDNLEGLFSSLSIFTDPYGLALGPRRISVSTAGHLDGMRSLCEKFPQVRLALSLHTPFDAERSRLMPINRRFPLASLMQHLRERFPKGGREGVLLQYTLIAGVNDDQAHAAALIQLIDGINAKVNLIPLNEVEPSRLAAPAASSVQSFRNHLHGRGLRTLVRYSKGQDIAAACGQLVVSASASIQKKPSHSREQAPVC